MKIVVLGKASTTANAVEKVENDTYHYVDNPDEALEAIKKHGAQMLVIENNINPNSPLTDLMIELNRMPQDVKVIVLSPSRHYFLVGTNTLNTSVNYHITEKKTKKGKKE